MISKKFMDAIVNQTEKLSKTWCGEVRKSEYMKTYQKLPDERLMRVNKLFFDYFAKWITQGLSRKEIGNYFVQLGKERYEEKFPLSEIHYAVILAKRVVRSNALSESLLNSAMEVYQVMELGQMVSSFFDTGNFYITKGYLQAMHDDLARSKKFTEEELTKYFPHGSFFKQDIDLI
jgi:hypothetical protein